MKNSFIYRSLKQSILTIVTICLSILLFSCEKEVNIKGIDLEERKVVVNSLISPNSNSIFVSVSLSTPLLNTRYFNTDNDADIIKNATVKISDGITEKTLEYNEFSFGYSIDANELPILEGNTYYLEVSTTHGNVTAECTVPKVTSDFVDHISYEIDERSNESYYKVRWMDVPHEENFYHIGGKIKRSNRDYETNIYFDNNAFKSDINNDGMELTTRSSEYYYDYDPGTTTTFSIIISDENYHLYFKTITQFEDDDNPFVEPTPLPSNIVGGVGLFAAYQRVDKTFN